MPKHVLMLGLDCLLANMIEKFTAEGDLPNFQRLLQQGCFSRLLPCIPAQTPANWATVATGATPGRHSITVWGGHRPEDPAGEVHRAEAFSSGLCLAEYLWETGAREGKRAVVMNYAGYPPTTPATVHIDRLYQPTRSFYDVCEPTVYHTTGQDAAHPIELADAEDWQNVPDSALPPLEMSLPVVPSSEGDRPIYHGLLLAQDGAYDMLLLCSERDAGAPLARLREGDWTEWLRAAFVTEEMGPVEAAFRFKLVECSADAEQFRLYRSDAFPTDGRFVSDPALGRRLVEQLGPYVHAMQTVSLELHDGILDWETTDQVLADEAEWWARAARIAMDQTEAELLYLHWHLPDHVGHKYVARVDPTGGEYDPDRAEAGWAALRRYYRAMDRFVGAFLEQFDPQQDVIAIASDHGMPANRKAVALVNAFREKGWVSISDDGTHVVPEQSKLFVEQNHLWINLQGREPTGVVPPERYEELRAEVQALMRDMRDPETGEHVFSFVLTREEAPVVGLYGRHVGDLVFCYAGGYRWSGDAVLRMGEERVVFPCGGGNHGPMIPCYETETTTVYGMLMLAGPGVREGLIERPDQKGARSTLDVAPTLAHLMGMPPLAQSEGRVLHEFLSGFTSAAPERELESMARPLARRPRRTARPQLKGDVTDEGN